MVIRPENENDFGEIYDLVEVAFQTAKVSNGKEQDFVNQLRDSANYLPELALVAEEDGKLIGHIMLKKTFIASEDNRHEALLLAPISVKLEHRNQGIGAALVNRSFELAKAMGHQVVLLVGDPAYYRRFGFRSAAAFGIKHSHDIPDEYVMACELAPGALNDVSGTMDCA
jgi:putative acetyltransferase